LVIALLHFAPDWGGEGEGEGRVFSHWEKLSISIEFPPKSLLVFFRIIIDNDNFKVYQVHIYLGKL
jgi:hypothetical protein